MSKLTCRRTSGTLAFLIGVGASAVCHAQSVTLVDTFIPPGNGFIPGGVGFDAFAYRALRFVVPGVGSAQISAVELPVDANNSAGNVEIVVWAESGGQPSVQPVQVIVVPPPIPSFGPAVVLNVPVTPGPFLIGGQPYWVGVRGTLSRSGSWSEGATGAAQTLFFTNNSWTPPGLSLVPAIRLTGVQSQVEARACCNPRSVGLCAAIPVALCQTVGGIPAEAFSTCEPQACNEVLVGACCFGAFCTINTQSQCAAGRFLGFGTVCGQPGSVNPCCPAEFNSSGTATAADIFEFLNAWFAGCP